MKDERAITTDAGYAEMSDRNFGATSGLPLVRVRVTWMVRQARERVLDPSALDVGLATVA